MLNVDRRVLKNFDWLTLGVTILICCIGIMTIYSATRPLSEDAHPVFHLKQTIWFVLGFVALLAVSWVDYIWIERSSRILYGAGIVLLIVVFFLGRTGMGAQRWLSIGPLSFQPSEFFKIAYTIMLAHYLSANPPPIDTRQLIKIFFVLTLLPFVLLIEQPDLGTAMIIIFIFLSLIVARGLQRRVAVLLVVIGFISLPFLGNVFWQGLKEYQKNRIVAFIDQEIDPSGIGYQLTQSKITVGSGKLVGKGYLHGTQGPFRFLPEKQTDFIFAVFAEEWGFLGSVFLLTLYLLLILRGLDTAQKAKDEFGRLLALGITFMFLIYLVVNVGMTLGLMPVVGIPLPFMSYGGTALLSNLVSIGILINIRIHRFELFH